MKLDPASVTWAITSLHRRSDTDLFPRPVELDVLLDLQPRSTETIAGLDLQQLQPSASRRFIVPKDDLSYRAATQLDPLDSIILTALIHQFGAQIEARRIPTGNHTVFSYRFGPTSRGDLYQPNQSWNDFWSRCYTLSRKFRHALRVDVSDFYNQVSHHVVENQLIESGLPNQATQWILRLLKGVTANVSRGLPVGPHAAHLLAEASLIPVDNSLVSRGIVFCRFVDDIVVFVQSEAEARQALYHLAEILDKQQRLQLQRAKTRIFTARELQLYCDSMIEDRPINDLERHLLDIIKKHSAGNPYAVIFLNDLSADELRSFNEELVLKILDDYFAATTPDFIRLRWFLRRLAQVGHPAAVPFCLQHLERLLPALADVCHYLVAVGSSKALVDWPSVGEGLLDALKSPTIQSNEYFQLSILGLFGREAQLDHTAKVLGSYKSGSPAIRREVILGAASSGAGDWLRELKEDFPGMDPWTKRAFLFATKRLPSEERGFFLKNASKPGPLEGLVARWASR